MKTDICSQIRTINSHDARYSRENVACMHSIRESGSRNHWDKTNKETEATYIRKNWVSVPIITDTIFSCFLLFISLYWPFQLFAVWCALRTTVEHGNSKLFVRRARRLSLKSKYYHFMKIILLVYASPATVS